MLLLLLLLLLLVIKAAAATAATAATNATTTATATAATTVYAKTYIIYRFTWLRHYLPNSYLDANRPLRIRLDDHETMVLSRGWP